jgi:hypothetical protein
VQDGVTGSFFDFSDQVRLCVDDGADDTGKCGLVLELLIVGLGMLVSGKTESRKLLLEQSKSF